MKSHSSGVSAAASAQAIHAALRAALAAKLEEIDRRIDGLAALRGELARRLHELPAEWPLAPGDQAASSLRPAGWRPSVSA
ncbi:hypothetical protein E7V67_017855 [[Empedobacter] haloabium]|uniref:Uncharacterized protein n=1 Tax=[Empedobacter] haloabium TaxID=592317 RepID=A0ABZ1UFV5_9BURK